MKKYFSYKISYKFIFVLALTTGLVACGSGGGELESFDIPVQMSQGCPDLASFHGRLAKMPPDGWVRRHTINMNADDHTTKVTDTVTRGGAPRANFLSVLYYSNFELTEQRVPEFQAEIAPISQVGCERVVIGTQEYMVREFSSTSIRIAAMTTIKDAPFEKESIRYDFRNPRSIDITRRTLVQDPCPHYDTVFVTKTTRMTWGHNSDPEVSNPQEVDSGFVRRAMRAVYKLPTSLNSFEASGTGIVSMSVSNMADLRNSPVRRDMQACPYRAKPTTGEDPEAPLDPELATPTPAPSPEEPAT